MAGPSADRITEWEGGSLSELVAMLQAAALPVRIEVIAPGTTGSNAGEVHLLAGGLADAFAGSLRRDDAMAALQRLEGARYVIESRLPHPESGSLSEPGPHQGSLKDRPLASLMRYCEEYVLTCRVEVWRGQDRAVISYRRGEIIGTVVRGSEGSELLPEVMGWTEGAYEIMLPAPVLPQMPSRGRDGARSERKRHSTLPMMTTQEAKPEDQGASRAAAGTKIPVAGAAIAGTATAGAATAGTAIAGTATAGTASAAPPRPGMALPAVSSTVPRVSPQPTAPRPAPQPPQQVIARPLVSQPVAGGQQQASPVQPGPAAQKVAPRQPSPVAATPRPIAAVLARPLPPETTARGTPPVPTVPLVPAPAAQPAPRPTMQGAGVPLIAPKPVSPAQPKPAAPAQPKLTLPTAQPAAPAQPRPNPFAIQPAPQAQPRPNPLADKPAAPAQPRPIPLADKPAAPAQPKPIPLAAQPAAPAQPRPIPLAAQPAPRPNPPAEASAAAQAPPPPTAPPPAQPVNQPEKPQPVPARPPKPSPAASNDLMPTSGTFEAKPKHANYLPPTTPPIQIADDPQVVATPQPSTPVVVPSRPPAPRRQRAAARKGIGEHPVRVYVFVGLAIGAGIVLAYWAYWFLPFGHH